MLKYAVGLLLLVTIGVLYSKYKDKHNSMNDARKYKLVQQFLLKNEPGFKSKPIIWIFNERHTNKPYVETCIESIVKYCGDDFNICLIDEKSFQK